MSHAPLMRLEDELFFWKRMRDNPFLTPIAVRHDFHSDENDTDDEDNFTLKIEETVSTCNFLHKSFEYFTNKINAHSSYFTFLKNIYTTSMTMVNENDLYKYKSN